MRTNDKPDRWIPRERWIANLIEAANAIGDQETQERRWLAEDAFPWERPEELICVLFDDCVFELFIEEYCDTFSEEQASKARALRNQLECYTPKFLNPAEVLANSHWDEIRSTAREFVAAFKDKWP